MVGVRWARLDRSGILFRQVTPREVVVIVDTKYLTVTGCKAPTLLTLQFIISMCNYIQIGRVTQRETQRRENDLK